MSDRDCLLIKLNTYLQLKGTVQRRIDEIKKELEDGEMSGKGSDWWSLRT